jgi:hypothetical protein
LEIGEAVSGVAHHHRDSDPSTIPKKAALVEQIVVSIMLSLRHGCLL